MHGGLLCIALRLSVCYWTKNVSKSISKSIAHRVMKFDLMMKVDDPKVNLKGQGHESKVKVTRSKKHYLRSHLTVLQVIF